MKMKPSIVMTDLEEYVKLFNISLSEEAMKTLLDVEKFAYRCDNPVNFKLLFSKVIRNSKIVQDVLIYKGAMPNLVALILEKDYYDSIDEVARYQKDNDWYSQTFRRRNCEKTAVIDRALEYCVKDNRDLLENTDIFLAAMDEYEKVLGQDGGVWTDKELNKEYITLSHVYGWYDKSLWVKFEDIREALKKFKKDNKRSKVA
ncbi:MAG: hypothetical protein VB130_17260 [Clostridium sp.]|nr:hypothetical protein [Clostridium sp.]